MQKHPTTLGALRESTYEFKSIKDELRNNLIQHLKSGKSTWEGIHGYEKSVIPQVERAILSKHNINFLGLRGQAKTRIARLMTQLLDEYIPVLADSPLNEDPLHPISNRAVKIIAEKGDDTPIRWLHREERYFEKLATPDVSVADLIGDIDPIKAANLRLSFGHEEAIHYGMIPRANRCIFVINELPDLQARIQVALFNILQEGDVQIRGFKLRLPLDLQFIFTANPEDYTNRGSIVTPLKDRIGSQILTHYPEDIATSRAITAQEAKSAQAQKDRIAVGELALNLIEQIGFEARQSEFIDAKSGVSARLSISALENLLSAGERRILLSDESKTRIRLIDFMAIIPAITGKVELVYEGEQEGAEIVAENLIGSACKSLASGLFPNLEKVKVSDAENVYGPLIQWFSSGQQLELYEDQTNAQYEDSLKACAPLMKLVRKYVEDSHDHFFAAELILWALAENAKLNRERVDAGVSFNDLFSSYLKGGKLD